MMWLAGCHPAHEENPERNVQPSVIACLCHLERARTAAHTQRRLQASFIVNGATPAQNSALTSAGAELRLANGVTLLAKFDGEFASNSSTYGARGPSATGGRAKCADRHDRHHRSDQG
jgi:hypothetical protein